MRSNQRTLAYAAWTVVAMFCIAVPAAYGQNYYMGTDANDTIQFGCVANPGGGFRLAIVHSEGDAAPVTTYFAMNTNPFIIHARPGDDRVEAVENITIGTVTFAALSNLRYSQIILWGGRGNDTLIGTPGPDRLLGGSGDDEIHGRDGFDTIFGHAGNDKLYGEDGNDSLNGGSGNDLLVGHGGHDVLRGGDNDDHLSGWGGNDNLFGEAGDDFLCGDQGNDLLRGGEGNDTLVGGTGDDSVDGEAGTDTFWGRRAASPTIYDPQDHNTAWSDTAAHAVEIERIADPYRDWVLLWQWGKGMTYFSQTTSSAQRLLDDQRAGARILMGQDGEPVHTIHKQYGASCGPASLAIVMDYLGLTGRAIRHCFPRDLTQQPYPRSLSRSAWPASAVDAGYHMSMEHIIYEAYHRQRQNDGADWNPNGKQHILDAAGRLVTADDTSNHWDRSPDGTHKPLDGAWYQIRYNIGNVTFNRTTGTTTGRVQTWFAKGGQAGTSGNADTGLPYVANRFAHAMPDAWPHSTTLGPGKPFASFDHLKAVIRGFIDHNIPLVVGVEGPGHFNVLMGYWDTRPGFYVYTADPLDGWGRPFYSKAMRWRKVLLQPTALADGVAVISGITVFGYSDSGVYGDSRWARDIDRRFGRDALCGHLPDCALLDLPTVRVGRVRGRWKVMDRRGLLFDFARSEANARRALEVIQHHRIDHIRFVRRPDPTVMVLISGGHSPVGAMRGEDAVAFDPERLSVRRRGTRYELQHTGRSLLSLGPSRREANEAIEVLKWYRVTHICYVGGRGSSFYYFRR